MLGFNMKRKAAKNLWQPSQRDRNTARPFNWSCYTFGDLLLLRNLNVLLNQSKQKQSSRPQSHRQDKKKGKNAIATAH